MRFEVVQKEVFGQPFSVLAPPKAPKSDFNAVFGSLASQKLHNFIPLVPSAEFLYYGAVQNILFGQPQTALRLNADASGRGKLISFIACT
jgi:hypothetical protein